MVLCWGFNWTVMKIALGFVSPLNLVMQRLLLASIMLLPVIAWKRGSLPKDASTWLKLVSLSIINAVGMTSTHIGLLYEVSGLSSILTYTQPLFVFCLAIPFLGEKPSIAKALGVILGFSGVALIYSGRPTSLTSVSTAIPFLILGALIWAITIIYYKKFLSHVNPEIVNIMQFVIGAIFLFAVALPLEGLTISLDHLYIFSMVYLAVPGTAIAFTIWLILIRSEEATVVSTSSLIVPAIALFAGWLLLKEAIEYNMLLGFTAVLIGLYLVNRTQNQK